jgi:DNA-binding transcriptional ArsR family regulator
VAHTSEHRDATAPLGAGEAERLAETIGAFATASRLKLLWAMLDGERNVEELSELTGLTQSSASQQLRVLRQARLVRVRRVGRRAFYGLHDHHVPELLTAMRHHHEHVHPEESPPVPAEPKRASAHK